MYSSNSCVYSIENNARAICSNKSAKENVQFLTGSCIYPSSNSNVNEENFITLLDYHEDQNQIELLSNYSHKDRALYSIDSSNDNSELIITCGQDVRSSKFVSSLWKFPERISKENDSYNNDILSLEEIAVFGDIENSIVSIAWQKNDVLLASNSSVCMYHITESNVKQISKLSVTDGLTVDSASNWSHGLCTWNPHSSSNEYLTAFNTTIQTVDARTGNNNITGSIKNAHCSTIRDINYNPNKPLTIISAGDDRNIKIWDLRNCTEPVKVVSDHSHWIWSAKYNPFHDQLIISGGSDNIVNLYRIASCSSSPWIASEENENEDVDIKVKVVDEHEDSVYSVAWSSADAWVYASLSYDGRVLVSHVPSAEKYKILL